MTTTYISEHEEQDGGEVDSSVLSSRSVRLEIKYISNIRVVQNLEKQKHEYQLQNPAPSGRGKDQASRHQVPAWLQCSERRGKDQC